MIKILAKQTVEQKMSTHFGVKLASGSKSVKEVDMTNRIVKFIGNTYFYIDSDQDMLIPGCASKSINDRGPQSNATAKIKHQSDHVLNTKNVVGRFTVVDERNIDGMDVLYCESHIAPTTKGNDDLINYQEQIYDNHSIGFRYKKLEYAEKDSTNEEYSKNWAEFYPKALNPEKADEHGFFYVIKEIELFEISVVSYGANKLTANLTGKSKGNLEAVKTNLFERLDNLNTQLKSSASTKDDQKQIDMEILQLKQIITELNIDQPSKKSTEDDTQPLNDDTIEKGTKKQTSLFIKNLSKN